MFLLNSEDSGTKYLYEKRLFEPAAPYVRDHDVTTGPARHLQQKGSLN